MPRQFGQGSAGAAPLGHNLTRSTERAAACALALWLASCHASPGPGEPLIRLGDEISVCGQLFHTGTRVLLWNDAGGYDAYSPHCRFNPDRAGPSEAPDRIARYGSLRGGIPEALSRRVRESGWTLDDLRQVVSQVVVHFDACGTSRKCFEILHDVRGLSCHFLLDLDGTIYQTLDLKERAWHAAEANNQSVGIEIANIGAYGDTTVLERWYTRDAGGARITLPSEALRGNLPPDFVGRPARPDPVKGRVNSHELFQYDFTEEQYSALGKLLAALRRVFPGIRAEMPQSSSGGARDSALGSDEELYRFSGILGHYHVTREKVDPGPAFQWERALKAAGKEE